MASERITLATTVSYKHNVAAEHESSKPLTTNDLRLLELRIKSTRILVSIPDALWDMCKLSIASITSFSLKIYEECDVFGLDMDWLRDRYVVTMLLSYYSNRVYKVLLFFNQCWWLGKFHIFRAGETAFSPGTLCQTEGIHLICKVKSKVCQLSSSGFFYFSLFSVSVKCQNVEIVQLRVE